MLAFSHLSVCSAVHALKVPSRLSTHPLQLRLLHGERAKKLYLSQSILGLLDKPKRSQKLVRCRQRAAECGLQSMRWLEVGAGNGRLTWHLRAALRDLERCSTERSPAVHLACCDSGLNGLHQGTACGCARSGRAEPWRNCNACMHCGCTAPAYMTGAGTTIVAASGV